MLIPFQIVVSERGTGEAYAVRASASGRSIEAELLLPALSGDPTVDGGLLGQALFVPTIRQFLLDVAKSADESGARIQIQLRVVPSALVGLPWEWMSLGSKTLWLPAAREDYALVRVIQGVRPPPTLTVAPPLRLLIAAAPGCDAVADALGTALASEVRSRRMIVDRLRNADALGLADALGEEPCHLLHLITPAVAGLAGGPARAALPRLRLGRTIDPPALATIIAPYHDLRMVTLAPDGPESVAPLVALAAALHEHSGMTTLALGDMDVATAADFCAVCYSALAAGEPVDLAVTYGRADLVDVAGPWGAAQLFVGAGGENLFRLGTAPVAPTATTHPVRTPRPAARRRAGQVDDPTQPVRPLLRQQARTEPANTFTLPAWLTPRVMVLIVASLILIVMISQNLSQPDTPAPRSLPTPTIFVMPSPWGTALPPIPTPTLVR